MTDRGSAAVEFPLVGTLVVLLFLGVLQVGLYLHLRNVVVASLAEGARDAANADRDCADGLARARDLVATAVGRRVADGLTYDTPPGGCEDTRDGVTVVRLRVRGPLPLLLVAGRVDATAHAVKEGR